MIHKNVYRITNSRLILYELKSFQSAHVSNIQGMTTILICYKLVLTTTVTAMVFNRGRIYMVVGFITTCAISAYHH